MDAGGIYEDGTPEQIFEHPQGENTRRFIRKLKVLELDIDSRDYDFRMAISAIDRYCQKNQIPAKMAYRIQQAYEELVQQMLLPNLKEPRIHVGIEYSESEESTDFSADYNGEPYDVTEKGDAISLSILKSAAAEIRFTAGGGEYGNRVVLRIDDR